MQIARVSSIKTSETSFHCWQRPANEPSIEDRAILRSSEDRKSIQDTQALNISVFTHSLQVDMVVQMQASLQLHDASKMASHTQRRKRALSSDSSGSDVSFHQTDAEPSKANRLGISTNSALREGVTAFTCTLPPTCSPSQPTKFSTSDSLSAHYQSHHAHVCSAAGCRKMFPSEIFLDLHLNEWHNPMNQVRLERGDKIVGSPAMHSKREN